MAEDYGETLKSDYDEDEPVQEKKSNKIWIIVVVVVVILGCCCLIGAYGGWYLWNNGDEIFGLAARLSQFLL